DWSSDVCSSDLVRARRIEDFRRRRVEGRQQLAQSLGLGGQLRVVGGGVELRTAHGISSVVERAPMDDGCHPSSAGRGGASRLRCQPANQPSLTTNSTESTHMAGLSSRQRPASSLTAVQAMKPKAMPWAMEKVSGMARAVTTTGAATVMSSQSMLARLLIISTATNSSAGAVA